MSATSEINQEKASNPPTRTHHSIIDEIAVAHEQHVIVEILHASNEQAHLTARQQIAVRCETFSARLQMLLHSAESNNTIKSH